MTDKEKQIEKMANIIQNACNKCNECELYNTDMFKDVKGVDCVNLKKALNIYNAGCRIISEGSVVLSENQITCLQRDWFKFGKEYVSGKKDIVLLTEEELLARDKRLREADAEYIKALEECVNNQNAQARKETARKIYKLVDSKLDLYQNGVIGGSLYDVGYKSAVQEIKFSIKKQYGVEVEE